MRPRFLAPLVALAVACAPKPSGVQQVAGPATAAVVTLLSPFDAESITALPQRVNDRIDGLLQDRKFSVARVPVGEASAALTARQTTEQRLRWLADQDQGEFVVLVESTAVYNTQIEGRFRWSVEVVSTIADADELSSASSRRFTVPVHLQFVHEKDEAAVRAAGVVIERQISRQVDQWLRGQQAANTP